MRLHSRLDGPQHFLVFFRWFLQETGLSKSLCCEPEPYDPLNFSSPATVALILVLALGARPHFLGYGTEQQTPCIFKTRLFCIMLIVLFFFLFQRASMYLIKTVDLLLDVFGIA